MSGFQTCHPERSENIREVYVLAKSKDSGEVDLFRDVSRVLSTPPAAWGELPAALRVNASAAGVLRLHRCFASRTSDSAQDDKTELVKGLLSFDIQ